MCSCGPDAMTGERQSKSVQVKIIRANIFALANHVQKKERFRAIQQLLRLDLRRAIRVIALRYPCGTAHN